MEFEEGNDVLCVVEKIIGTTVFVKVEEKYDGTITTSEIAPGRIRNLREYVFPGKRIVCKILKVEPSNLVLSLRRVNGRERKEVMDRYDKEKNVSSVIKSVVKERANDIISRIKEKYSLSEFVEKVKIDNSVLNEYFSKAEAEKVLKIISVVKEKVVEVKKSFILKSEFPDGVRRTKEILEKYNDSIKYLSAGNFVIMLKAEDYKKANNQMAEILEDIRKQAKSKKMFFQER